MGSKNKEVEPYHIFLSPYHITYPIYPYMIIKWRIFLVTAQRFSFRSSQSDSYHWRKPLGAGGLVRCNGQVSDGLPPDVLHDTPGESTPLERSVVSRWSAACHFEIDCGRFTYKPSPIGESTLNPLDRRVAAAWAVPNKHTWSRLWRILASVGR